MKPKSQVVDLPVYQPGKPMEEVKRELGLTEVIKLASNENPYGSSPKVKEAVLAELANTHIYPDGGSLELSAALSQHLGVQPDQLIFGAGSDEIIAMIVRAYLSPGDETVMATHTFPQYKHNAVIEGAVCIEVPLKDGTHDLQAMLDNVNEKTKIVWICNPNNPTGTMVSHAEVERFMEQVPSQVMVVHDEAYCEYNLGNDFPRSLELLQRYPNFVALRTFSKIYGLAALRIGYGIAAAELIQRVNQVRGPFNTTRYAQSAAIAALSDQEFVENSRIRNGEQIAYLTAEFSKLGLTWYPAFGNFIMVDTKRPAKIMFESLMRKGIIVRGGHSLGFPTAIRVTVGSSVENQKFIAALAQVLDEISVSV